MKLTNIYKSVISEMQGISQQARAWSYVLNNLLKEIPSNNITLSGKRYPEVYNLFPVDIFYIKRMNFNGGAYDEDKSGYDENGNYCVYLIIGNFDHTTILNHELRHAFEDFNRISKGKTRISKGKETQSFYNNDFEKIVTGEIRGNFEPFKSILSSLYYTSKLEESAFSENVYDNKSKIMEIIKKILDKDYLQNIPNDKESLKRWDDLKSKVSIPILNKFNDYLDFITYCDKIIQKRAGKMYKKLLKVRYLSNEK